MTVGVVVGLAVGLVVGLALGLSLLLARRARMEARLRTAEALLSESRRTAERLGAEVGQVRAELGGAMQDRARLASEVEHTRRSAEERAARWEEDRQRLVGSFAELSDRALQQNTEQFLELADQRLRQAHLVAQGDLVQRQQAIGALLEPFKETLTRYEEGLRRLEMDRKGAYEALTARVANLGQSQAELERETRNLVTALRSPQIRGRWGEVQLRRVVELAGMLAHCDFDEQVEVSGVEGRLRPDMVVHVPGGGQVAVDAKVPLEAFLKAAECEEESQRAVHLVSHARQLRTHVDQMAKKEYWKHVGHSADQVVVFVPGDALLAAAFEHDPHLQEHAMASGILLATPTTLIALLRTIAHGWRQEVLAENARRVQELGAELYDRLRRMAGHLGKMQRSLMSTVEAFNQVVGSFESRVLVTARKFPELGAVHEGEELPTLEPVESSPRHLVAADLCEDLPQVSQGSSVVELHAPVSQRREAP